MKDLNDRFETWYRLTHWMSPPLDRRAGNGEYEDAVVHCMYLAYRAGFNRARKESKAELRRLHEANEAFGKRQEWWNERMFALERQRDELLEALKLTRLMLIAHGETHAKIDEAIARAEGKQ